MMRKIKVSGACQTAGITAALRLMLPADEVTFLRMPFQDGSSDDEKFHQELADTDVWVTNHWAYQGSRDIADVNPGLRVIKWPQIVFAAFHPDITLATWQGRNVTSMGCVYNSALCLWGWKQGLPVDKAVSLFHPATFRALGYLDLWDKSVARLRRDLQECELNFEEFYLAVKRQDVFMYSHLHAKKSPIIHIARQLAGMLGADKGFLDGPLEDYLEDTLAFDAVWPVYPDIADVLGVSGHYLWKYRQNTCHGLKEYIERSYSDYDAQAIDRNQLQAELLSPAFDQILSTLARG